jgi:hypothetical protein
MNPAAHITNLSPSKQHGAFSKKKKKTARRALVPNQ